MNKIIISIIAIGNCLTKEDMIQSKEQVDDPLPSIGSVLDTLFTETTFQQNIITLFSVLMGGLIIVLLCCCCIVLTSPLLSFCLVWSRLQNVLGARFQRVKSELAAKSGQKNKTDNDTIIELSNSRRFTGRLSSSTTTPTGTWRTAFRRTCCPGTATCG